MEDKLVVVVGISGIKEDNPFESNARDDGDFEFGVKDQLFVAAPVEFVEFEGAIRLSGDTAGGADGKGAETTDRVDSTEAIAFKGRNTERRGAKDPADLEIEAEDREKFVSKDRQVDIPAADGGKTGETVL